MGWKRKTYVEYRSKGFKGLFPGNMALVETSVLAGMLIGDPITGFAGGGFVGLGISVLLAAYAVQSVFHIAKNSDEQIKVARENERLLQQLIRHGLPNSAPPTNDTKLVATRHAPSRPSDDSKETSSPKLSSPSNLSAGERVIEKRKSGDFVITIVEGANNHRRYLVGQASFSSLEHAEEFISLRK